MQGKMAEGQVLFSFEKSDQSGLSNIKLDIEKMYLIRQMKGTLSKTFGDLTPNANVFSLISACNSSAEMKHLCFGFKLTTCIV